MSNYVETFISPVDFPKPFQRTGKFPLDRTDLFDSYEDASKYAAGDKNNPDSRGLCGTSYVGQTITVYENGVVTDYKILADRSLREVGSASNGFIKSVIPVGSLSTSITIPEGCLFSSLVIRDSVTGEQIFTDTKYEGLSVLVSIAGAYSNPLNVVATYYSE